MTSEQPRLVLPDGTAIPLGSTAAVLGRGEDCDVLLPAGEVSVSRSHAVIHHAGDTHAIQDLGSGNGTLVNGAPAGGSCRLYDGDVVRLGDLELIYRTEPDPPAPEPEPSFAPDVARQATVMYVPSQPAMPSEPVMPPPPPSREPDYGSPVWATPAAPPPPPPLPPEPPRVQPEAYSPGPVREPVPRRHTVTPKEAWLGTAVFGALLLSLSLVLPWVTIDLFLFGGSISYLEMLSLLMREAGAAELLVDVPELGFALFIPLLITLGTYGTLAAKPDQRWFVLVPGVVGLLSGLRLYMLLTSLGGSYVDVSSVLGAGYGAFMFGSTICVLAGAIGLQQRATAAY